MCQFSHAGSHMCYGDDYSVYCILLISLVFGRSRDFYHTCYCLSGLSVCQHFPTEASHGDTTNHSDDEDTVILVICLLNLCCLYIPVTIVLFTMPA